MNKKRVLQVICIFTFILVLSSIVMSKGEPPPPSPPPCGGNGQMCCGGSSCNSGLVCISGTCQTPPPCLTYSPGCYDQRDEFASFGTLTIDEFKVYYSQQVCIESNPAQCKCTVPQTTSTSGQKNPDDSSSACSCIANSFWDTEKRCCDKLSDNYCVATRGCHKGKDQGNCGVDNCIGPTQYNDFGQITIIDNEGCIISGSDTGKCGEDRSLTSSCSGNTLTTSRCNGLKSETKTVDCNIYDSLAPNRPNIASQPKCDGKCGNGGVCSARDYGCSSGSCSFTPVDLDTGEDWCNSCNGTEWSIGGSQNPDKCCGDDFEEYITVSKGDLIDDTESCCSSSSDCNFLNKCYSAGEWSNTTNNFLCDNGQWRDGDSSAQACTSNGQYTWTGTRCCGDDSEEYYNEPNKSIACWNGIPVFNKNYVTSNTNPIQKEVINANGSFEGCNTDSKPSLKALKDSITAKELVHNNQFCAVILNGFQQGQHSFCSSRGIWNRSAEVRDSLKKLGWTDSSVPQEECCTATQCWDGSKCLNDQSTSAISSAINGNRCIKGEWSESPLKTNSDESAQGYCPKKTQCLVNPTSSNSKNGLIENFTQDFSAALNNNIQCINDTQYIGDNYCEEGNWSARTKLLALAMLDSAESTSLGNYTLYCDIFSNVLNNFEYSLPSGFNVKTDLITSCAINATQLPCSNNFCVLKTKSNIIVGTTINTIINKDPSILEAFELPISYCNNALANDGQFHSCTSPLAWYNNKIKAIVFSKTSINLNPQINFFDKFILLLKSPFSKIFGKIQETKPSYEGVQVDLSFLQSTKKFSRLYISSSGDKSVKGVIEIIRNDPYLSIQYSNPSIDVCSLVQEINKERASAGVNILFCNQSESIVTVSSRYQIGNEVWQDLTSKLRST